jgi:hypothetical protein
VASAERGFRGVMSAALLLQAIVLLLGLPVAAVDGPMATWELTYVLVLVVACIAACAFVRRTWILALVAVLQLAAIGTWFVAAPLGVMGVIFAAVWGVLLYFRGEYRRRLAAGTLPSSELPESHD